MGKSTKNQESQATSKKDRIYHAKINDFIAIAFQIISTIVEDERIKTYPWVEKIKLAWKALDIVKQRASGSVPNQELGEEIFDTLDDIEELPEDSKEAVQRLKMELKELRRKLRETRVELEDMKQQNKQLIDIAEQSQREMREVSNDLKRKVGVNTSLSNIADNYFLSEGGANEVQGTHYADIEGEQGSPQYWDWLLGMLCDDEKGEGSSNVNETCIVRDYTVFKRNADVLNEILEKYPNIIAENFGTAHPDLQSYFMNSLAELYQKITGDQPEMLDQKEIEGLELKIADMERNGLQQLSCLKDMLVDVRESKRLQEVIDSAEQLAEKAKLELAERQKKRRLK